MKITINQVPQEGLYLKEAIDPKELDLDTDLIKFRSPVKLAAQVDRITNALTVDLNINGTAFADCSRCLSEFEWVFNKDVKLTYPLESSDVFIDLNPQIREEIILDYPIKPLCKINCKGLCLKCGKNKNEGGCNCGST
ncbi:MAG: YceD family protein [Candidatus Omnitrophica bacterium]|nr:YceD family protein [Candidatus Omnitrophota bacterium]